MSAVLLVAVVAVAALAYVAAPARGRVKKQVPDVMVELEEQKLRALRAILELEDERDVGKLSDEDLVELRKVYEAEALDALQRLDASAMSEDDPLEREIAAIRGRLAADRCSSCGAVRPASRGPCPTCGS